MKTDLVLKFKQIRSQSNLIFGYVFGKQKHEPTFEELNFYPKFSLKDYFYIISHFKFPCDNNGLLWYCDANICLLRQKCLNCLSYLPELTITTIQNESNHKSELCYLCIFNSLEQFL